MCCKPRLYLRPDNWYIARSLTKTSDKMKHFILAAAAAFLCGSAFAQAQPLTPQSAAQETPQKSAQACAMPDMKAVHSLELTDEQMMQVREIHAECERDCAAAKAETGSIDHEVMARHQERIREVLTPEQYARYQELEPHSHK
jgi:Spy/CpxP family protein refolding chaperone